MANNLIQIKRSLNTATPASLANGELAFTSNGGILFIGANGGIVPIAGTRNPGTLTANQALVANATSGIDKVIVANAVISRVWANGSHGSAGFVLTSGGTSDNAYWVSAATLATSPGGSNTNIQYNDSNTLAGATGFNFDKTTNNVTIANTLTVGSATVNTTNYSGTSNNATHAYGKTESNLNVNNALTANLASYIIANNGLVSNSSGVFVNANTGVTANSSGVFIGQAVGTTNSVTFLDLTINGNTILGSNSQDLVTVNGLIGSSLIPSANVTYDLGSSTNRWGDLYLAGDTISLGNVTISDVSGALTANLITANVTLKTQDLNVEGNSTIGSAGSDRVTFNALVSSDVIPSANVTYRLGNNTLRFVEGHFGNVHSVDGYFTGNVDIDGNLVVSGNVITTNVQSIIVSDPIIHLAGNNTVSDLLDIGFTGKYFTGGSIRNTGLFRRASDDEYYLFRNLTQNVDTVSVINVADPTFAIADLNAYLQSGGLVTNATHVAITANSSVNVSITANTLTLSTALAATSGGTGLNTYTSGDILVANSGNALSKLALGTSGYVLQSNGTALIYDTLDGGTF